MIRRTDVPRAPDIRLDCSRIADRRTLDALLADALRNLSPSEAGGARDRRALVLDDVSALPLHLQSSLADWCDLDRTNARALRAVLREPANAAFRSGRLSRRLLDVLTVHAIHVE